VNPTRVDPLEVNEAEDGLVVYDPGSGMVHHLNATAAVTFDLCDGSRDPDAIARLLGEAFGLEAPPREEALAGLNELAERGLIRWDPP
jgi:PqqD family protein of HPr-rel-A system